MHKEKQGSTVYPYLNPAADVVSYGKTSARNMDFYLIWIIEGDHQSIGGFL